MFFSRSLLSVLVLVVSALSASHPPNNNCTPVSPTAAQLLVDRWIGTLTQEGSDLGTPEQTWSALLTDDFKLVSGSIQTLQHFNLTGNYTIYVNKSTYISSELKYSPIYHGVQTLDIIPACGLVVWYWQVESVQAGYYPVRGVNIFHVDCEGMVSLLVVENDSLSFGVSAGANVTFGDGVRLP